MSQAGARGPASPPKPPPTATAKPASPAPPPVAPKGVAPAKGPPAAPPARVGKTTMLGVQAPKAPAPAPPPSTDDSWDVAPTRIEDHAQAPAASLAQTPTAPAPTVAAVTPVAHAVAPVLTAPSAHAPAAAPAPASGLTASDVRLIVRTIVEDALLPLQRALVESQQRIAELERRPAAAATVVVSATPAPAALVATQYTSAIAAPARSLSPQFSTVPPAPLLDVAAIERDVPLDVNNPFDGARRRRRMAAFLVVALLAVFGGLFALLAESYTPHP